jgi:transmembrane sensor
MMDQRHLGRIPALVRRLLHPLSPARTSRAMSDDSAWHTMARYCARERLASDAAQIEEWCAADPERERVRRGLLRITALSRDVAVAYQRQAAWEQLARRIETTEPPSARVRPMFVGADTIGHRRARPRRSVARWSIATAAAAMLLASIALYHYGLFEIPNIGSASASHEYASSRGERIKIDLADGSSVVLGPESRLRVAQGNFAHSRIVHLDGMAHFTVAHDQVHPFVVYASGSAVQAVGTAFTVRAYPDDSSAMVVVNEGRVLLRSARASDGSGTVLDPGDLGRRSHAGVVSVTHGVDLNRYLGWMSGQLSYDLTPAREIARDLGRWYDLSIVIADPGLGDTRINGYFDRGRSAEQTLTLFTSILGTTYERRGDTVFVGPR